MSAAVCPPPACLVVRGSRGLCLQQPPDFGIHQGFMPDESKTCKAMQFSPDGSSLAWSNMSSVQISCQGADGSWRTSFTIPQTKVYALQWSPLGRVLATWEQYSTTAGQEAKPNLHLWDTKTGEKIKSFFQRKFTNWCPIWNKDESICSRNVTNEVQFYGEGDFQNIKHKIHLQKVADYSMSTNLGTIHVVTYVPGAKGAPSFCRIYQFPNFDENQVIANKSFYQADTVELKWNGPGTAVLILTQAEVDKTGGSYYGKQQLHYMSCRGDTSLVSLNKEGPIYSVSWSPDGDKFAVVYGFMPAKASLFNHKADLIFEYGTGPKNLALFNPQSSILMIGGFGNLRGRIEMWELGNNSLISTFDAPDSTDVKWNPDGQHILTSTCAPRLRQGNGYKVWHYSGALMHEKAFSGQDELWEADWQSAPTGTWPKFRVSKKEVQGITPSQPQVSKQVYRPPGARGAPSTFKLHDDEDTTTASNSGGATTTTKKDENLSKTALKNKKKREAAKKRKEEEGDAEEAGGGQAASQAPTAISSNGYQGAAGLLFDAEREKKIRKITDKIKAIEQLKLIQAEGKTLEKNQMDKLQKEAELLAELEKLRVK